MNIAYLSQNALTQRETASALRRLHGVKLVALEVPTHPVPEQAESVCRILREHRCAILFTTNEWGCDDQGIIAGFCTGQGVLHVNWSVDDPFYEEIILQKKYRENQYRIDFVSDKGYVEPMLQRGYRASFLPLATDTSLFYPESENVVNFTHDIVFVGNSYTRQMDAFLKIAPEFIDVLMPFLGIIVQKYLDDMSFPVEDALEDILKKKHIPPTLTLEKACYIAKHAAGYFARKKMITALVNSFPGFKVYGEPGWQLELPNERIGSAKYYDTLCTVYRSSKISLDINRMVIRNGFTQRAFDAPASGSFLLTSDKPVIGETFVTTGNLQEVAVFDSLKSLREHAAYYLRHEDERRDIARRGSRKVIDNHTYDHRIAEIFRVIAAFVGKDAPVNQMQAGKLYTQARV